MGLHYFLIFLSIFGITILLLLTAKNLALRANLFIDIPNQRSSHSRPVPRCGGIVLVLVFFISMFLLLRGNLSSAVPYFTGGFFIALVGLLDDLINLKGRQKILGMVISALLPISLGLKLNYLGLVGNNAYLLYLLTFLWIYGMINAFNFMDGIDGLISGVAAIGALFIFILAVINGNVFVAMAAMVLLAACLGFLVFNFSPASIFLGDAGSMFLGYNFAILGLMLTNGSANVVPIYVSIFIFAPIIYDSLVTFVRRALERKNVIEAHREHLYQRLIILGMSHRDVSLVYYALSLLFGLLGLLFFASDKAGRVWLVILALVIMGMFSLVVKRFELSLGRKTSG